jgi:hypothetical protein
MEEQLRELYKEKETLAAHFPGLSVREIVELTRSVQNQLDALYEDHIDRLLSERDRLSSAFPGMTIDEIIDLAHAGMRGDAIRATGGQAAVGIAENMEQQLIHLYSEKETLANAFPGKNAQEIVQDINNKVRRLEALYAKVA